MPLNRTPSSDIDNVTSVGMDAEAADLAKEFKAEETTLYLHEKRRKFMRYEDQQTHLFHGDGIRASQHCLKFPT